MSSFQPEDFPILCETCLGDNPYLRMTREQFAKSCKICDRPFTVYRWRPGPRARFKKTEICGTCAKLKNVCQTCILDLQYGLPVQVRDEALNKQDLNSILNKDVLPVSHTNRNYMYEQLETQVGLGGTNTSLQLPYNDIDPSNITNQSTNMLSHIQRKGPYYKRNLPHICSFYARGTCNRGDACPYRHVHPNEETHDKALKDQNIKDRFYGVNDPVATKLLNRFDSWKNGTDNEGNTNRKRREMPSVPTDTSIRSLFMGGIDWSMNEDLVRNKFGEFGEITSVVLLPDRKCGFVTFGMRESAEKAMNALWDVLYLNKRKCELNWARNKKDKHKGSVSGDSEEKKEVISESGNDKEEISENSNTNTNTNEITKEDTEYLKSQGILPPKLPPMPDPTATTNTAYIGKTNTQYKSMTAHYNEAKV